MGVGYYFPFCFTKFPHLLDFSFERRIMKLIEIHEMQGRKVWYATYSSCDYQEDDRTVCTPYRLTMPIDVVLAKVKKLNPYSEVIHG
jgi:hypothetical protein